MQGLMWRAFNDDGTLTYSFVESVKATYPVLSGALLGGLLFFVGMLIMAYNVWMTMRAVRSRYRCRVGRACGRGSCSMSHEIVEKKLGLLTVLIVLVISVGGLVEIVPLALECSGQAGQRARSYRAPRWSRPDSTSTCARAATCATRR